MMSFKNKIKIAFGILGVVTLSVIIGLVVTIVAFSSNENGGVAVSYTAKNISATIQSDYMVSGGEYTTIQTTDGADVMTFVGNERGPSVTKSFKKVTDITLGRNSYLYVRYIITNTNPEKNGSFIVCSMSDIKENNNLKIEYGVGRNEIRQENSNVEGDENESQLLATSCSGSNRGHAGNFVDEPESGWKNSLEEAVNCVKVKYGKPIYVYARFSVDTKTQDASFDGSFNFSLMLD